MTETEWLASDDPRAMLDFVADPSPSAPRISDRKLRLFACAVARLALPRSTFPRAAKAIEIGEWYADGADMTCQPGAGEGTPFHSFPAPTAADRLAMACCSDGAVEAAQMAAETWANGTVPPAARIALLLEAVGNPFRPVKLSLLDRSRIVGWEGGLIRRVAQAAYEDRDFDSLPVLADALEEAGCIDDALLTHLHSPGPHVRGCWALDCVLGKG